MGGVSSTLEIAARHMLLFYLFQISDSKAVAKLGDFSRATLYSACLPGWLNM